jgi:hypothetical protein
MEGDQGASHVVAGGIGVKAALDGIALADESSQPAWVRSGSGGREAAVSRVESKATDGVDGRLHQDEGWEELRGDREKAQVLL